MGFFSKLFGTEKKIINTNEKLLEIGRQLIPSSQLDYFEKKIMFQFHKEGVALQTVEYIGSILLQPNNNPVPHHLADKIMRSQFIERYATYYGLNCFFAGWLIGYAERNGRLGHYQVSISTIVRLLNSELERELLQYFNNQAVFEAFYSGNGYACEMGLEKAKQA